MPKHIEKSGDLIVCHPSGTNEQTTNKDKERWGYSVIGPLKAWMSNKANMVDWDISENIIQNVQTHCVWVKNTA